MDMINPTDPYLWLGKPIQYMKKGGGLGLVIGKMHYAFNKTGDLVQAEPLKRYVLLLALKHSGEPNPELMMVAKAKAIIPLLRAMQQEEP